MRCHLPHRLRVPSHAASRAALLLPLAALVTGCFGGLARKLADREVYPIIERKQELALGTSAPFTIEATTTTLTQDVLTSAPLSSQIKTADQLTSSAAGQSTTGLTINLAEALALAIDNSREYQSRKERLYLAALDLTEARDEFSPFFSGTINARMERQPGFLPATLPGELPKPTVERFGRVDGTFGVTKLFATGARVSVGLTQNFLKQYAPIEGRTSERGEVTASLVQPLLQGFGPGVTLENLRQSERDVIYAVRDFARFRQDFVIERMTQYYRLLEARDRIDVEWQAYQRLVVRRQRAEAMMDAERMDAFEVDQARQDEISARSRWVISGTSYQNSLTQFKLDLGLPVNLDIEPALVDLSYLREAGLVEVALDLSSAERIALDRRLDLATARDEAEDAERRIKVVENSLLPVVDARADLTLPDTGENDSMSFNQSDRRWSAGLDIELPLERKRQRNDYREAVIARDAARRAAEQLEGEIRTELRQQLQDLDDARQTYALQLAALELAERRVDNVRMLFDIGREGVSIRDQLDAEESLRDANNAVTRVLVDFAIARLRFFNAIDNLEVDEFGMWNEQAFIETPTGDVAAAPVAAMPVEAAAAAPQNLSQSPEVVNP